MSVVAYNERGSVGPQRIAILVRRRPRDRNNVETTQQVHLRTRGWSVVVQKEKKKNLYTWLYIYI